MPALLPIVLAGAQVVLVAAYVELLTCLELAKAAGNLPPESRASGVKP